MEIRCVMPGDFFAGMASGRDAIAGDWKSGIPARGISNMSRGMGGAVYSASEMLVRRREGNHPDSAYRN